MVKGQGGRDVQGGVGVQGGGGVQWRVEIQVEAGIQDTVYWVKGDDLQESSECNVEGEYKKSRSTTWKESTERIGVPTKWKEYCE